MCYNGSIHEHITQGIFFMSEEENGLKIFEKPEFGSVRVVEKGGEPWFVAKDVCKCLELENVSQALASLDEDEKNSINPNIISADVGFDKMMEAANPTMPMVMQGLPTFSHLGQSSCVSTAPHRKALSRAPFGDFCPCI